NTTITAVNNATTLTLSANATASGSALTFTLGNSFTCGALANSQILGSTLVGSRIVMTGNVTAALAGQSAVITAVNNVTGQLTFSPSLTAPNTATDTFYIIGFNGMIFNAPLT